MNKMVNQPKDASSWLSFQLSGDMTQEDKKRFQDWLSISDDHRKSYIDLQEIWKDLHWDETLNQQSLDRFVAVETQKSPKNTLNYWYSIGAMAACLLLALGVSTQIFSSDNGPLSLSSLTTQKYVTSIGEVKEIHLEDGSVVTLAGNSKIDVSLSNTKRRVKLLKGDAFFDISPDSSRRFYVASDLFQVEVVGTSFEINSFTDEALLNVISGIVRVQAMGNSKTMTVGQQLKVDDEGNMVSSTIDIKNAASWRNRRLSFRQSSLENFVSEINQYYAPGVHLESEDLKHLSVTTAFNVDQMQVALSGVASSLGLTIKTDAEGEITLSNTSK